MFLISYAWLGKKIRCLLLAVESDEKWCKDWDYFSWFQRPLGDFSWQAGEKLGLNLIENSHLIPVRKCWIGVKIICKTVFLSHFLLLWLRNGQHFYLKCVKFEWGHYSSFWALLSFQGWPQPLKCLVRHPGNFSKDNNHIPPVGIGRQLRWDL